jgi:hypothetical protein
MMGAGNSAGNWCGIMGEVKDLFGNLVDVEVVSGITQEKFPRLPRCAEFMVCAYLTKLGYYCVHVDTIGFDIILDYEGHSYRVDVKATSNYQRGPRKESCEWSFAKSNYKPSSGGRERYSSRPIRPDEVDLLALYHLEFDSVVFVPVLRPMHRMALPAGQVRAAGNGEASLSTAIQQLRSVRPQAADDGEDEG